MTTSMIRRGAPLAPAAALALSACSAQEKASCDSASPQSAQPSQSASPQAASNASSGTATNDPARDSAVAAGIDLNNLGDPIASVTIPAHVDADPKATLKVSMYSLQRRGDTLIGNYSFTLNSTAGPELNEWLYDYLGSWSWTPHLIDTVNLNRHDVLSSTTAEQATTSSQGTMETEEKDGPETVITLAFDILFAFDKADISDRARAKIERLADKIPDDASVEVSGHTDSIGSASYNKNLSQQRAKAVAAILETAQPDLKLDVEGFGKDRPVAPNSQGGEDNPEGRALNRRVEIRYEG